MKLSKAERVQVVPESKTARVILSDGTAACIDSKDAKRVSKWCWTHLKVKNGSAGYAYRHERYRGRDGIHHSRHIYLHRFLMRARAGEEIDHRDNDGLNCRRANLRRATRQQNTANTRRFGETKTGYRGVSFSNKNKKYAATITHFGVRIFLGLYRHAKQAARAYDAAALERFGSFAKLNFGATL